MARLTLTRQQLYDRAWATPIETLARELGLSGRGLGKLCQRCGIPVPPRGYWAKKTAGHAVSQPPLPPPERYSSRTFEFAANRPESSSEPETHPLITFERNPGNRIIVPDDLVLTSPKVLKAERVLAKAKRDAAGLTIPTPETLQIRAARGEHERALRILQVLLGAFATRSFPVEYTSDGPRVVILEELLGFAIEEQLDKVEHRTTFTEQKLLDRGMGYGIPKFDLVPSSRLALLITNVRGVRQRWTESSAARAEDSLNKFIIGLIRAALALKQQRAEAEQREREHQESERLRREAEARAEAARLRWREEQAKIQRLERLSEVFERYKRLQSVVSELRSTIGSVEGDSHLGKWLSWAGDHLERSDPFRALRDRGTTIELYYYGWDRDQIERDGFREAASHGWENKDPKSGIKLTERPPDTFERALKIVLEEDLALPYEWPQESDWSWRVFRVPAGLLNQNVRFGNALAPPPPTDE